MLHHNWSTQTNEALNKSVSSYAPKDRTFCSTKSLMTRVSIAAGVQVQGYHIFWNEVFSNLNLDLNRNLSGHLEKLDKNKETRKRISATKEGKIRRSKSRYDKLSQAHRQDIDAQKNNTHYESGVAMKRAKMIAQSNNTKDIRNPPGTPKENLKCKFYHEAFCTTLGHSSCKSKDCFMNKKSKTDREIAERFILDELARKELETVNDKGKLS